MVLWELLTGRRLMDEFPHFRWNVEQRRRGSNMPKLDALNDHARALLEDCWKLEPPGEPPIPAPRPPFSEIVRRLCDCSYNLLADVNVNEVNEYLGMIVEFERNRPPCSLYEE
jgi:hypothetical protein